MSFICLNKSSFKGFPQWTFIHEETGVRGRTTAVFLEYFTCQTEGEGAQTKESVVYETYFLQSYLSVWLV